MVKTYTLLLLSLLTGIRLKAQDDRKLADNIYYKQLPNGLEMLVIEDHTVPLATLDIAFKAGAINQVPAESGLIPLYCAWIMRGNSKYPQDFSYHGGGIGVIGQNRISSYEETDFFFTLPKDNLRDGLEYLSLPIRSPLLLSADLEKEKQLLIESVRQKYTIPGFAFQEETNRQLWGDMEYRKRPNGDTNVVNSATPAMMYRVGKEYFNPDNAMVTVGGDVDHNYVFKQIESQFGDWQSSAEADHGQGLAPEFKPVAKPKYFIVSSSLATTPEILIEWHGPDTRNDMAATYAADVFSYIANQNSSRLRTALVNTGLATNVSVNYLTLKHTGPISITVYPNPAKVKECFEEVARQVSTMDNDDYITDEQIATAKRILEIQEIRREDVTSDFVRTLVFWWGSASLNYYFTYLDNLRKVTRADLKRYVDTYIKNQPFCEGLLISPEQRQEIKPDDFFGTGK